MFKKLGASRIMFIAIIAVGGYFLGKSQWAKEAGIPPAVWVLGGAGIVYLTSKKITTKRKSLR